MTHRRSYYGLIGNGETAALIGPDLAVGWLCIPRFDGVPVFAAALDPVRGGALSLQLVDELGTTMSLTPVYQRYREGTALLETVVSADGWLVEVLDWMPWGKSCLVREVRLTNHTGSDRRAGVLPVVTPVSSHAFPLSVRFAENRWEVRARDGVLLVSVDAGAAGESRPLVPAGGTVVQRVLMGYGPDEQAAHAALGDAAVASATDEARWWTDWLSRAKDPGTAVPEAWRENYFRSLITLKLMQYERTGALIAAPTASFPAVPGGGDNWDYRYLWLRDGYLTAMAFDAAGLHKEARRFYEFAFTLQTPDGHWHQPLYTVDGGHPPEFVAEDLRGPGGEGPIRFGNAAADQLQLDNEGSIIHGLWFHWRTSGDRSVLERYWENVRRACEWTAVNWHRAENGIWEIREYAAHWVHGKVMCAVALEAGARIAEVLGHAAEANRWREVAVRVREDVVRGGWYPERRSYLRHYGQGSPEPPTDISVLSLAFYGVLAPDDPRILDTVAQIEKETQDGGLMLYHGVCRYDYAAVPFYLPTIWLARYYLMAGKQEACDRLVNICLDCATDLGLMAEHFDGRTGEQWGNFPQAFSHEELVRLVLERAQGHSFHDWDSPGADGNGTWQTLTPGDSGAR